MECPRRAESARIFGSSEFPSFVLSLIFVLLLALVVIRWSLVMRSFGRSVRVDFCVCRRGQSGLGFGGKQIPVCRRSESACDSQWLMVGSIAWRTYSALTGAIPLLRSELPFSTCPCPFDDVRSECPSSRILFKGGSSDKSLGTELSEIAGSDAWAKFAIFSAILTNLPWSTASSAVVHYVQLSVFVLPEYIPLNMASSVSRDYQSHGDIKKFGPSGASTG